MRKILVLIAAALPVILSLVGVLYSSLPSYSGSLQSSKIGEEVTIIRDSQGVPFIRCKKMIDCFYGIGFAQAQDRLWSMDMLRRVSTGTLSELLGERALEIDRFSRNIGIKRYSEKDVADSSVEALEYLQKFADGVNEYAMSHRLPPEYLLIGGEWKTWTPRDSIAILKLISLGVTHVWGNKFLKYQLDTLIGRENSDIILGTQEEFRRKHTFIVNNTELPAELRRREDKNLIESYVNGSDLEDFTVDEAVFGSNAWVISGNHTKSGKPIVSSDPHLPMKIPPLAYLLDVKSEEGLAFSGSGNPGLPVIVSGKTQAVSFASTAGLVDVIDIYLEKRDKDKYLYSNGTWLPFQKINEVIYVKDKDPVHVAIETTLHGPVLQNFLKDNTIFNLIYKTHNSNETFSLRWAAVEGTDTTFKAMIDAMKARDLKSYETAASEMSGIYLSFVFADEDNIGYLLTGRIPKRSFNSNRILPGWDSRFEWEGYLSYNERIKTMNPEKGFLVAANNNPADSDYKYNESHGNGFLEIRAERITQMIESLISSKKVDVHDMLKMQCDVYNIYAKEILTNLQRQIPMKEFEGWDFQMDKDSAQSHLFAILYKNLAISVMADELTGKIMENLLRSIWYREFIVKLFSTEELFSKLEYLCDDKTTEERESCVDIARIAYQSAVEEYKNVKWGDVHWNYYTHDPFSKVQGLDWLFSRKYPASGSYETVKVSGYSWTSNDFIGLHGAVFRMVYDWNAESSLSIQTGQSGHFLSSFYDNQAEDNCECAFIKWSPHQEPDKSIGVFSIVSD